MRAAAHTFRATRITSFLLNGGELAKAQRIANHESSWTTELYNRTDDEVTLDEIERIRICKASGAAAQGRFPFVRGSRALVAPWIDRQVGRIAHVDCVYGRVRGNESVLPPLPTTSRC